jgi:hypothetical protein
MEAPTAAPLTLDDFVERYEEAQYRDGTADLGRFLAPPAPPR